MKKITRILAIVMAIAVLACPLASAAGTAVSAGTSNALNVAVVQDNGNYAIEATISAENGFMLAIAEFNVTGIALADADATVKDYEVIADVADANTDAAAEAYLNDGVLKVYVSPKLNTALSIYASVTVSIPVTVEDTYAVSATTLKAATDIANNEYNVEFGFTDTKTGAIDTEAAAAAGLVISVEGTKAPAETPVDDTIVFSPLSGAGLAPTSVKYTFRINQSLLNGYADFDMVLVPDRYDTTTFNKVVDPQEVVINKSQFTKPNSTLYAYEYTDIQLYELGLNIKYYIKCYDAEGNYIARSEYFNVTPSDAIKTLIKGNNAKLDTALTDLLVICDEAAQLFAPNDTCDLATATSVLVGVDLTKASQSVPTLNAIDNFNATNSAFGTASGSTYRLWMGASVEKVPVLTYRLQDKSTDRIDTSKLVMTITYTSVGGGDFEQVVSGDMWVRNGNFIAYTYSNIGLHDSATPISAVVTYNGEAAFTQLYTIESYLNSYLANPTIGDMMVALAKFGTSFRAVMGL